MAHTAAEVDQVALAAASVVDTAVDLAAEVDWADLAETLATGTMAALTRFGGHFFIPTVFQAAVLASGEATLSGTVIALARTGGHGVLHSVHGGGILGHLEPVRLDLDLGV